MKVVTTLEGIEALLLDMRTRLERLEEKLQPEPTCLPYPAAAQRLGVGLTKLKQMVKSGDLRASLIGKVKMISLAEIHRVSTPLQERPQLQRAQAAAKWVPLKKERAR